MLNPNGYIVADGSAIYGAGDTKEAALIAAAEWMDEADDIIDYDYNKDRSSRPRVQQATTALIEMVREVGGAISWGEVDYIACTDEEESC